MPNLYASLQDFCDEQNDGVLPDAADQRAVLRHLNAASRQIELDCRRHFYQLQATKQTDLPRFRPIAQQYLGERIQLVTPMQYPEYPIPDLVSATQVAFDSNGDYSYAQICVLNTDYEVRQEGGPMLPGALSVFDPPWDKLILLFPVDLTIVPYLPRARTCQIIGTWGYSGPSMLSAVDCTVTLADDVVTAMTSSDAADLSIGQTLLVESEQVYISGGSGTSWVVQRAVNGTVGAVHSTIAPQRYSYPAPITDACIIATARLWARRRQGSADTRVQAGPGLGQVAVYKGTDSNYAHKLSQYVRNVA